MKTNYIKQAWTSLRQQPVVSIVSVAGTALAIFLIMLVVMIDQVQYEPFAPESNRDRWLIYRTGTISNEKWGTDDMSNGPIGFKTVKQVLYRMEVPEAVTAFSVIPSTASISLPNEPAFGQQLLDVDDGFWKVFDFTFVEGKPFTKEDFDSGLTKAVVSESTAKKLFGTTDVVGREMLINHTPYNICGVVEDVSNLASFSYADIWVPFTSTTLADFRWSEYMGGLSMIMLAKDPSDMPAMREECHKLFDELNKEAAAKGWKFHHRERPYTQLVMAYTVAANKDPDMDSVYRHKLIDFLILLIVPAVNLSSMTHSRMVRRREEIGVRRAFGAKRSEIVANLFFESLIITIVSGLIGLLMSLICGLCFGDSIFNPSGWSDNYKVTSVSLVQLFHWSTFAWTMLFCFILNLLSAALPSIIASRVNIVNAISGKH